MRTGQIVRTSVAALGLAFLASCNDAPSTDEVTEAGYKPETSQTLSCYDYSGNKTLEENPTGAITFKYANVTAKYENGRQPTIVMGGAGCIADINYTSDDVSSLEQNAPYTVVVTNGSDKILLTGQFSEVSFSGDSGSGGVKLLLQAPNGANLRKVGVTGLNVIATENSEGIAPGIVNALQLNR